MMANIASCMMGKEEDKRCMCDTSLVPRLTSATF